MERAAESTRVASRRTPVPAHRPRTHDRHDRFNASCWGHRLADWRRRPRHVAPLVAGNLVIFRHGRRDEGVAASCLPTTQPRQGAGASDRAQSGEPARNLQGSSPRIGAARLDDRHYDPRSLLCLAHGTPGWTSTAQLRGTSLQHALSRSGQDRKLRWISVHAGTTSTIVTAQDRRAVDPTGRPPRNC